MKSAGSLSFHGPSATETSSLNLLLCAPLGIASALYFRSRRARSGIVLAFGVSLFGEWLQVYSHSRFPSATDLFCNVAGAVAAALVVRWPLQRMSR